MNYRNGKPLGATILPGMGGDKVKPENNTVFMTYEELAATWKPIRRRERWTRK